MTRILEFRCDQCGNRWRPKSPITGALSNRSLSDRSGIASHGTVDGAVTVWFELHFCSDECAEAANEKLRQAFAEALA